MPTTYRLPAQFSRTGEDAYGELEEIVGRLSRLVLGAHALAQRRPPEAPGGDERGRRLLAGADLGRRALAAAVRLDMP